MLFDFYLGPNKQKFKSIFYGDPVIFRSTVHQKLCEMEQIFALSGFLVQSASLVHINILLLCDLLIESLIEFPQHEVHFAFSHLHSHFFEHLSHFELCEVLVAVAGWEIVEHSHQVLLFGRVDDDFLKFLLDGFLFFGLPGLKFL